MVNDFDEMLRKFKQGDVEPTRDEFLTDDVNSQILSIRDTSEISDGSHTFGELYHHRAVLSAVVFNQFKSKGWKSKMHNSGSTIKGFFIVGIQTPEGQFTYHYPMSYWKMFKVDVCDLAPEWDGHSSGDIERLFSLLD